MPKLRKVLVVDDDHAALIMTQAALRKAGFEATTASSGEEALTRFRAAPANLVLLDVEMPGMSGHAVCAELRRQVGSLLPIVMLTGRDDLESVEKAYEAGATDFIGKPVNWALIGHRVKCLLRSYEASLALQEAEARNKAILDAIPDALLEVDVEGRNIEFHSLSALALVAPGQTLIGRSLGSVLPSEATLTCLQALREAHTVGLSTRKQIAIPLPKGTAWFELSASRTAGGSRGAGNVVLVARNITDRRAAERKIKRLAYFDTLTGLPNREQFNRRCDRALQNANLCGHKLALINIDLDNFKRINDTLGHSVGDELLRMMAVRLREALRTEDEVGHVPPEHTDDSNLSRLGGDEFMVLLPEVLSQSAAGLVAERIRRCLSQPIRLALHEVLVTPSIGISVFPADGKDRETLFRNADLAMYFAKRQAPGTVAFFEPKMNTSALQRLTMEARLRGAQANGELSLEFQPQFDLATGQISGMEALLRWASPDLGSVPPAEFIPIAEETGLILSIGEWVLRSACAQAVKWLDAGLPMARIAVNVSGAQLSQRNFPALVGQILRETGLPAQQLELEITESVLMLDEDWAGQVLKQLKELGVAIAIDDFGTGYSSFRRLREFPIDRLKIDKSFVHRLQDDGDDRAIAAAIITMARTLRLDVVAEGIEDMDQLLYLQSESCNQAQGFLLSRPLPVAEAEALLRKAETGGSSDISRTTRLRRLIV